MSVINLDNRNRIALGKQMRADLRADFYGRVEAEKVVGGYLLKPFTFKCGYCGEPVSDEVAMSVSPIVCPKCQEARL